jgi:hypothetical protein
MTNPTKRMTQNISCEKRRTKMIEKMAKREEKLKNKENGLPCRSYQKIELFLT